MATGLLLLHGFTHSGASWGRVEGALGERYRPLAPDLRGHALASDRAPVSLPAVLDDLDPLVGERTDLVGYSMGGRVALHLALADPARVRRLILIGASPGLADPSERAARRRADERLADEIEGLSIEAFATRWAQTPVLAGLPAAVAEEVQADRLRSRPSGLAAALRGLGTGALPSLWERLGELALPITLIVGERDVKFRSIAGQMAERLPQAGVEVVPDTGHAVHLEAPQAVADVIAG